MALAVTDALDGGMSLDEGGMRTDGAFTCWVNNNNYCDAYSSLLTLEINSQLQKLLMTWANFKIICNKHSMYCKVQVGKDSEEDVF